MRNFFLLHLALVALRVLCRGGLLRFGRGLLRFVQRIRLPLHRPSRTLPRLRHLPQPLLIPLRPPLDEPRRRLFIQPQPVLLLLLLLRRLRRFDLVEILFASGQLFEHRMCLCVDVVEAERGEDEREDGVCGEGVEFGALEQWEFAGELGEGLGGERLEVGFECVDAGVEGA